MSDGAAAGGFGSVRTSAVRQLVLAPWRAIIGPLRWLATAAGLAAGAVWLGLHPASWRRPARAEFVRFMELAGVQNVPAAVVAGILVGISLVAQGMYWLNQVGEVDLA